MGVDNNTYVGVYVLIKPKKVQIPKKKTVFISETGKRYNNEIKFDPEDGSAVTKQVETYYEEIELSAWYQIIDRFGDKDENLKGLDEDLFYCPTYEKEKGYLTWLLNKSNKTGKSIEENEILDLTGVNIQSEIDKFNLEVCEELLKMKNYVEDIKICYGVINYQS